MASGSDRSCRPHPRVVPLPARQARDPHTWAADPGRPLPLHCQGVAPEDCERRS